MRVRCTARADYRSNAVGSLELECTSEGLCIALCGVSSYREGYAPGLPVHASDVCVPWPSVYATRLGEEGLLLSVDAQQLPLNRFLLVELGEPSANVPAALSKRSVALGLLGAGVAALATALALSGALPHPDALSTFGMAAALVAALLAGLAGLARRTAKRTPEELLREFSHALAQHLPNHVAAEIPTPPPRSFEPRQLSTLLPRSAVGVAITLAATTLAALVGSSAARPAPSPAPGSAGAAEAEPAPLEPLALLPSPPPPATATRAATPTEPSPAPIERAALALGDPCDCPRSDELPGRAVRPRLSAVVLSERSRQHDGHGHTELELAVVNDGDRAVHGVSLSVVFYEQRSSPTAGHFQTGERSLSWEGPLLPGRVRQWHVEGRGTRFDVIAPDQGTLAPDGSDAAPADVLAALAATGPRPLRLHATELLAFLADERAPASALALEPASTEAEAAYLARLVEAPRDVAACSLAVSREGDLHRVEACLFNRSPEAQNGLVLRVRALDAALDPRATRAPGVLAEHGLALGLPLLAHAGRRLRLWASLPLDPGAVPRAFEIRVEREERAP